MMSPRFRHALLSLIGLGATYLTAPWPLLQAICHTFLVVGMAPASANPLGTVLWACAAGWTVEGTLHIYPRLGGTPMADMILALAVWGLRAQWPPDGRVAFWGRVALLTLSQTLLVHLLVRFTAGAHVWGWGWMWALVTVPLWGTLAFRYQRTPIRR